MRHVIICILKTLAVVAQAGRYVEDLCGSSDREAMGMDCLFFNRHARVIALSLSAQELVLPGSTISCAWKTIMVVSDWHCFFQGSANFP